MDDPIYVVSYDDAWSARYECERAVLEPVLAEVAVGGIHHVGSTAVRGLAAKPVIDILAGVADLEASRSLVESLTGVGYSYAPYRADEMHWFVKPGPVSRTHQLHLVSVGSRRFMDELAFRDQLRADSVLSARYEALKHGLAARFPDYREAYTDAKSSFIRSVVGDE